LHTVTAVSCLRLCGAPVFIVLFLSPNRLEYIVSIPFLVILFSTDILDGFLARRWRVTSGFGYVLDGVADRSTHIALIVALITKRELSAVLGFFFILRDLLLYAARAFFEDWWSANHHFRARVKTAAIAFKLTVGLIALTAYIRDVAPLSLPPSQLAIMLPVVHGATWVFAAWSYILLAQQVWRYTAIKQHDERGTGD
jgi:CDP-diacylglycerol---glycerol-3-phosphate 3-phosphatidyltransferase